MNKIIEIMTNQNFIGAILIVFFFIIIGFILGKKQIINANNQKVLSTIIMNIGLPAMAFKAFLSDFSYDDLQNDIIIFLLGLLIFPFLLFLGKLFFHRYPKNTKNIYAIFFTLGQITFFSYPIIQAVYETNESLIALNLITIIFRFYLYVYSFIVISQVKSTSLKQNIKKILFNPIMIAMGIGIFIYLTQNFLPRITIDSESYCFLRIDKTLPALYKVISVCSSIVTPLCMILIGSSLSKTSIKEALLNKLAWLIAILRTIIAPLIVLLIVILTQLIFKIDFKEFQIATLVIGFAAPLSAVINTYCITYDHESYIASNISFISTFLCLFTFPILFIIISFI